MWDQYNTQQHWNGPEVVMETELKPYQDNRKEKTQAAQLLHKSMSLKNKNSGKKQLQIKATAERKLISIQRRGKKGQQKHLAAMFSCMLYVTETQAQ